jgi:hypothetical protein
MCFTAMSEDLRKLRLADLSPHDTLVVRCECGRIVEYLPGVLIGPRYRRPPSAIIAELRFRCKHCGRNSGFALSLADERHRS